jgi:choline dehydrogenase-like flavoprotein
MSTARRAIVVGSGPIGAVAARRLAEAGFAVAMLEQGAALTRPPGAHLRNAEHVQRDPDGYLAAIDPLFVYLDRTAPGDALPGACTLAAVGGQGIVWTNNCPRAVPDLELPALLPGEEWQRCYGAAEAYLGVAADLFGASVRQQRIAARLAPRLTAAGRAVASQPIAATRDEGGRVHYAASADVLAGAAPQARRRIELRAARVARLALEAGRARGVVLDDGTELTADAVLVAAGALETPVLLHRSGLRAAALGRWLTYHPVSFAQLVLDADLVHGVAEDDPPPRLRIPPTVAAPWHTMVLRDLNPAAGASPEQGLPELRLVEVQTFCPLDPDPARGMKFSGDGSFRFEVPLSAVERERMSAIERDVRELASALGRFRAGCEPVWLELGFAHVMGTCRASAHDDGTGVTDADGRVWGVDRLYLAGVALLPTRLGCNPTLTAAAWAIHTADAVAVA